MTLRQFKLEKFFEKNEFSSKYLLCCSDVESYTMQEVLEMADAEDLIRWNNLSLGYTEVKGDPRLREIISGKIYQKNLKPENVACFAGAEEGIYCALLALLEPQDHVICFVPVYQSLLEIPISLGCNVKKIELKEDNDWKIDFDELKKNIKYNTRCIIINFPHNPTGQVLTEDEQRELVDICEKNDLWLFSDEVYRGIGYTTPNTITEVYQKGISLGVMSKAFGGAGLRVGWVMCSNKMLIGRMLEIKHYTSLCNSAPAEVLSTVILKNMDKVLARGNKIVQDNLEILDSFIKKHNNLFSWRKPQGGCTGFVKYLGEEGAQKFCNNVLKDKEILLLPGSVYDYEDKYFRIGFGRKNMKEILKIFEEII